MQLQDDLVQFAAAQKMEQQQCENIKRRLRTFAREFFQVDQEAEVVRPLALLLGYIHSAAGEPLEARPGDGSALALEGAVGQLELFHACPMRPYSTKYQALFDPDDELDVYREAFFWNSEHNASDGKQTWMLGALKEHAASLEESGLLDEAVLVRRGADLLRERYSCFGSRAQPASCSRAAAWACLRAAMASGEYWFSVEELQLLMACRGCLVHVYLFNPDAEESDALVEAGAERLPSGFAATSSARVVLDAGDGSRSTRGHFSRLWSDREWDEHLSVVGNENRDDASGGGEPSDRASAQGGDENPESAPEDVESSDGASARGGDSAPSGESADDSSESGPDSDAG